jgi:phosphomevalonate kinase
VYYLCLVQLESLRLPRTIASLASIRPFNATGVTLAEVHKTGLGSSAALITSLTSALLVHLSVIPPSALLSSDDSIAPGRRLAHNLAQFVHCVAQGKVGSGFDVSAAVFGSHLYTRFDVSVILDLMNDPSVSAQNKNLNVQGNERVTFL